MKDIIGGLAILLLGLAVILLLKETTEPNKMALFSTAVGFLLTILYFILLMRKPKK